MRQCDFPGQEHEPVHECRYNVEYRQDFHLIDVSAVLSLLRAVAHSQQDTFIPVLLLLIVHDGRDDDQLQCLQRVNRDESVDLPVLITVTRHADTLVRKKYIKDQEDVEAQKHEKVAIKASLGRDRLSNADEEAVEEDGANDRANH